MNIQPRIKGVICTNAHPEGCAASVNEQIEFVSRTPFNGPKTALVVGASSGYGLASRIMLAFAGGADTLGVYLDRAPTADDAGHPLKQGTAGWYHNRAFEQAAAAQGLGHESINGDAFSAQVKQQVIDLLRAQGKVLDLLVYSVAAPRRMDEQTGESWRSVLKPVGSAFQGKTLDPEKGLLKPVSLEPASEDEIAHTVKVMGGEDWQQWVLRLQQEGLLAPGFKTLAYTYIGDKLTWPIYGDATIGCAKKHLDQTAQQLNKALTDIDGEAHIGVLKALVTQASAAIPVMPLYISLLYRVMKEQGVHETCIEQIQRLFLTGLYGTGAQKDELGRFRLDEKELASGIQQEVTRRWARLTDENLPELADFKGFRSDFLKLFGFRDQVSGNNEVSANNEVSGSNL
ncbi:MAG: trans-2-enoyl-CoA reductase family protein [Hahellaceae bacterium]|nr:trans-2-enoyl-CoA reductase family protein [Hahellaceae bacterium]